MTAADHTAEASAATGLPADTPGKGPQQQTADIRNNQAGRSTRDTPENESLLKEGIYISKCKLDFIKI